MERVSQFRSRNPDNMWDGFCKLFAHFGGGEEEEKVDGTENLDTEEGVKSTVEWDPESGVLTFRPLLVGTTGKGTFFHQRETFLYLIQVWSEVGVVTKVVVDFRDATSSLVSRIMGGATKDQVVEGMWIWRTFPCKVLSIEVLEPRVRMVSYLCAKAGAYLFLPGKVRRKVKFM